VLALAHGDDWEPHARSRTATARILGRDAEAMRAAALAEYERKGAVAGVALVRERLPL
jgi:hypothetical protein